MLKLLLIRHGQTEGNKFGRYIGTTDEPLCPEGREAIQKLHYEMPERVYASPRKRCVETAEILFPGAVPVKVQELSECDFGEFENKNYKELAENEHYQEWIDSNATLPFPGGESREEFRQRTLDGFQKVLSECKRDAITSAALVVHGGSIMTIMEAYATEKKSFYEWHVDNGKGYRISIMRMGEEKEKSYADNMEQSRFKITWKSSF